MIQLSKTSLFLFFWGIHFSSFAQQIPYYSAIRENWGLLNPAFLDFHYYDYVKHEKDRPDLFISGSIRHQYLKKDIGILNANFRWECYECLFEHLKLSRVKLSGGLIFDKIGPFLEAGGYGQFGWHLIPNKLMVAYGIKLSNQWLNVKSDDFVDFANDPSAQLAVGFKNYLNVHSDMGISYFTTLNKYNSFYFGLGMTQLWANRFRPNLELRKKLQWNGFIGFLLGGEKGASHFVQWEPVVLIKYIPKADYYWFRGTSSRIPIIVDWSIRMTNLQVLKNDLRLGLSGSTDGSINAEVGFALNKGSLLIISPTISLLSQSQSLGGIELSYTYTWVKGFGK